VAVRHQIQIASLGEGVTSAQFAEWLKSVGDPVDAGEAIAEVMTDKVNVEIEATVGGVLVEISCEPDELVEVGQVIGFIEDGS
jgi:2-oxoglutarate dehydrogenase E2 component (dihydrolipoamide succinyltransferase)